MYLIAIYRPPDNSVSDMDKFLRYLDVNLNKLSKNCVMIDGDIN